jgi:hypothetical protein
VSSLRSAWCVLRVSRAWRRRGLGWLISGCIPVSRDRSGGFVRSSVGALMPGGFFLIRRFLCLNLRKLTGVTAEMYGF